MTAYGKHAKKAPYKPKEKKPSRRYRPPEMSVDQWQVALRRSYGAEQNFKWKNLGEHPVFSEYAVTNPETGGSYRVAVRGEAPGRNYCSCPDFTVNTLGTCKHIEFVLSRLRKNRSKAKILSEGFDAPYSEIFLNYGARRRVRLYAGTEASTRFRRMASKYFDDDGILRDDAFSIVDRFLHDIGKYKHEIRCYDDALAFISEVRDRQQRQRIIDRKYKGTRGARALDGLLKVPLYPYQREGALFAARAGRAIVADDMGLGKTVEAIAATSVLAKEFGIENALIICPASLKYQWKQEIEKFSGFSAAVIQGPLHLRSKLYESDAFFKIVNYDVIHRDLEAVKAMAPDLVILDEAQRIKNWQTRRARSVKQIQSGFAIVLTGTPLENRLEELHSIVEFVDRYRLGPLFRFLDTHQIVEEESGKVTGYRRLKSIGETLSPILIRRTKQEVLPQLPERLDKTFFVPMTEQQWRIHDENKETVARIVAKWKKYRFLTEADQRRLLVALQNMRMACDSTYLLDQETCFGPKLSELRTLIGEILEQPGLKAVIFSQWVRMNNLVAQMLKDHNLPYVYLHGGVSSPMRRGLIKRFRDDPATRLFLSTEAGGVGLNLQSASVVINMDLPWNPAVLDQRIGRVHRIGQHRPVRVVNFVSEGTIEHGMLSVISFKRSVFAGVLDGGDDKVIMGNTRLGRFMEMVEETSGAIPETARDLPRKRLEAEDRALSDEEAAAEAAAALDASALKPVLDSAAVLLKELGSLLASRHEGAEARKSSLMETDGNNGRSYLRIPMPDAKALGDLRSAVMPLLQLLKAGMEAKTGPEQ